MHTFSQSYTCLNNLKTDFNNFYEFLYSMFQNYFPERKVTLTSRDPNYVTPYIKFLLRQRQKATK